ncbi:MAG TPA: hypothetical protein PKA64_00815 [Myxococcota bacterium]|nr:hypothetical protein [Myxococcota bacterium]
MLYLFALRAGERRAVLVARDETDAAACACRLLGGGWREPERIGLALPSAHRGQVVVAPRELARPDLGWSMLSAACAVYRVDPADALLLRDRPHQGSRWATWAAMRRILGWSYPAIARAIKTAADPFHHTTIMNAMAQVESLLEADRRFFRAYIAAAGVAEGWDAQAKKAPRARSVAKAGRGEAGDAPAEQADPAGEPRAPRAAPCPKLPGAAGRGALVSGDAPAAGL